MSFWSVDMKLGTNACIRNDRLQRDIYVRWKDKLLNAIGTDSLY